MGFFLFLGFCKIMCSYHAKDSLFAIWDCPLQVFWVQFSNKCQNRLSSYTLYRYLQTKEACSYKVECLNNYYFVL